jgi:hypothetical protein
MTRLRVVEIVMPCDLAHNIPGKHLDGCTDTRCPGCSTAGAERGSRVCTWHDKQDRDCLAALPSVWADLGDPRGATGGGDGSSGSEPDRAPISDARRIGRERIRTTLADICLTLHRPPFRITLPAGTVRGMALHIRGHLPKLLNHPDTAAPVTRALVGGWVQDDDGHTWRSGVIAERALLERAGATVRLLCTCGVRIPLEPDRWGIITCRGCGEWGTVDWWRNREAPDTVEPRKLSDLADWLLVHRGIVVTHKALLLMRDRGRITRLPEHRDDCPKWLVHPPDEDATPCPGCTRPMRFDPAAVAAAFTGR